MSAGGCRTVTHSLRIIDSKDFRPESRAYTVLAPKANFSRGDICQLLVK